MSRARPRKTLEEAVWSKVQRGGPDECWIWTGASNHLGYGQIVFRGQFITATAAAWWLVKGERPPKGAHMCHRCDNPPCVNPAHLFIGDAKANMRDAIAKGRFKFPVPRRGVLNNKSKLTPERVTELLQRYRSGETLSDLSRSFGMARSTLREVVTGRNWNDGTRERTPKGRPTKGNARLNKQEAIALYLGGVKPEHIALAYGVSTQHVRQKMSYWKAHRRAS